jgi:hypothetical protein
MAGTGIVNVDISGIMSGAGQLLKDIRTAWTGKNPELEAKLVELQIQMTASVNNAQAEINKVEAASSYKFVSFWRPAAAWVCVTAFALNYLIFPLINYVAMFFGVIVPTPAFNSEELMTLLGGLLGLITYRSVEKIKGVA